MSSLYPSIFNIYSSTIISPKTYQSSALPSIQSKNDLYFNKFYEPATTLNDTCRFLTFLLTGAASKLLLIVRNDFKIYNIDIFNQYSLERDVNHSLLTVSNHRSVLDDPGIFGAMMSWKQLSSYSLMRWGFCAREICFKNSLFSPFFYGGKAVPIDRGMGISQDTMRTALYKLQSGEWLHLFPEAKVVQLDDLGRFKWGCGKLIAESQISHPLILPFVNSGMEKLFDEKRRGSFRHAPDLSHRIKLRGLVGEPFNCNDIIEKFDKLVENNPGWGDPWPPNREELYVAITRKIEYKLRALYKQLKMVNSQENNLKYGETIDKYLISSELTNKIYNELIEADQKANYHGPQAHSRTTFNLFFPPNIRDIDPGPAEFIKRRTVLERIKALRARRKRQTKKYFIETIDCQPFQKIWNEANKLNNSGIKKLLDYHY